MRGNTIVFYKGKKEYIYIDSLVIPASLIPHSFDRLSMACCLFNLASVNTNVVHTHLQVQEKKKASYFREKKQGHQTHSVKANNDSLKLSIRTSDKIKTGVTKEGVNRQQVVKGYKLRPEMWPRQTCPREPASRCPSCSSPSSPPPWQCQPPAHPCLPWSVEKA